MKGEIWQLLKKDPGLTQSSECMGGSSTKFMFVMSFIFLIKINTLQQQIIYKLNRQKHSLHTFLKYHFILYRDTRLNMYKNTLITFKSNNNIVFTVIEHLFIGT